MSNSVQHSVIDDFSFCNDSAQETGKMIKTNLGHEIGGNGFTKYFMWWCVEK